MAIRQHYKGSGWMDRQGTDMSKTAQEMSTDVSWVYSPSFSFYFFGMFFFSIFFNILLMIRITWRYYERQRRAPMPAKTRATDRRWGSRRDSSRALGFSSF